MAIQTSNVLVIDPDPEVSRMLGAALSSAGIAVDSAGSAGSARMRLKAGNFDLALIDPRLPDGDGLALATEIRASDPKCEVIFATADRELEARLWSDEDLRAFDVWSKPFENLKRGVHLIRRAAAGVRGARAQVELQGALTASALELERVKNERPGAEVIEAKLQLEVARARRYGRPLSLVIARLDGLDEVLAMRGRDGEDQVVGAVLEAWGQLIREMDRVGRLDRQDVLFLFPETPRASASLVAGRLGNELASEPLASSLRTLPKPISASFGIAALPGDSTSAPGLLARAREALEHP